MLVRFLNKRFLTIECLADVSVETPERQRQSHPGV